MRLVIRLLLTFLFCSPLLVESAQAAPSGAADGWYTPKVVDAPDCSLLDEEGAGKLYQVDDWLLCVMEGTHEEMGFQHGRLLARHIRGIVHERYMAITLKGRGYDSKYLNEQSARMEKHFPEEYVREIKGVVKGLEAAGVNDVPYEALRLGICAAELQHHAPGSPPGCTNFAVFGQWTEDRRLLHGRNLDWNIRGRAQEDAVILVWRPEGGIPFMMVGWAGCIGSVSGMNAKGITAGEMTSTSPDETFDGLPLFLTTRRVLEKAGTLEEAVKIMKTSPPTLGWNYVIGDGKIPDAVAVEVDAKSCVVLGPGASQENETTGHLALPDAVRRTNHPCSDVQFKKVFSHMGKQRGMDLSDWEKARPGLRFMVSRGDSWRRYHWLGEQIQNLPGKIGVKAALQLLANGPVKCNATLHACVFDPKNHIAYVANAGSDPVKTASDRPFVKIDFGKWFEAQ
jgi:predicted choloylglycine hydrolase